eukprot:1809298-Amphidinium_carterae.1
MAFKGYTGPHELCYFSDLLGFSQLTTLVQEPLHDITDISYSGFSKQQHNIKDFSRTVMEQVNKRQLEYNDKSIPNQYSKDASLFFSNSSALCNHRRTPPCKSRWGVLEMNISCFRFVCLAPFYFQRLRSGGNDLGSVSMLNRNHDN